MLGSQRTHSKLATCRCWQGHCQISDQWQKAAFLLADTEGRLLCHDPIGQRTSVADWILTFGRKGLDDVALNCMVRASGDGGKRQFCNDFCHATGIVSVPFWDAPLPQSDMWRPTCQDWSWTVEAKISQITDRKVPNDCNCMMLSCCILFLVPMNLKTDPF